MNGLWTVDRHSGKDNSPRMVKKITNDEEAARTKFKQISESLRQGDVRLLDPAGNVVERTWAPRLRTRW